VEAIDLLQRIEGEMTRLLDLLTTHVQELNQED
jgi:hypothetical protein